ncbi:hypothetical protein ACIBJE_11180 [Micromonospora sp. NPDC050187]|uniref:hypothetical protein n=1 Tax=Micromonospora sp. NPDC050187 TaxID=3364277 RepID=UPI0037A6892A
MTSTWHSTSASSARNLSSVSCSVSPLSRLTRTHQEGLGQLAHLLLKFQQEPGRILGDPVPPGVVAGDRHQHGRRLRVAEVGEFLDA